ncbi:MAG TPA: thiolase domain-containing protein [Desulfobacterales bacterium]|nr:thiolase domain-containing protein [Desulfobacterales bacterium]HIP39392.1 thiolase domain-containing protein [Desulfocapsa sulfexigens]
MDYITGIGRTKFGKLQESLPELMALAIREALLDSSLQPQDIQAAYITNFVGDSLVDQLHLGALLSSLLKTNIPATRIESACASGGVGVLQARMALEQFDPVLVIGAEKMSTSSSPAVAKRLGTAGCALIDQEVGLIFPANYALMAQEHMREYGTTSHDLALIALKNHTNARLNPLAHFYHKDVDLEMIEDSPTVCSPLRLFDCSPISDGAVAVILSREQKHSHDPHFLASTMATDSLSIVERRDLTTFRAATIASKKAYHQAECTAADIDFAQVHDCFTIAELVAMEDLGFADAGRAAEYVRDNRFALSGDKPVNTDGGLKADGHPIGASGVAQIYETVLQLRGQAEKRQLDCARIGLTHNIGGAGGTCAIHILEGA